MERESSGWNGRPLVDSKIKMRIGNQWIEFVIKIFEFVVNGGDRNKGGAVNKDLNATKLENMPVAYYQGQTWNVTLSDVYFMVAFSQSYFVKHMKWLQMIDKRAGDFGYLSCHMPVKTYLVIHDLDNLANGWEYDLHYQEFTELAKTCVGRVVVEEEGGQEAN
jgi:hypothetical protein